MATWDIHSLKTSEWRALPPRERIKRYFSTLALPFEGNRAARQLARESPKEWGRFQEITKRRAQGDCSDNVYSIKNSTLRFSLLVTALERADMHTDFLETINSDLASPSAILDIGCENGLLTCFFALSQPATKVVGLDVCPAAIACARELAERLKLGNVDFWVGSARDLRQVLPNRVFDLVLTVTVLHDGGIFPDVEKLLFGPADCFKERPIKEQIPEFLEVAKALSGPEAKYIGAERCTGANTFWWWTRALDQCGLGVDWQNSVRLRDASGDSLTILVASPGASRPADPLMAQAFWIHPLFDRWSEKGSPPWVLRDQLAEAIFAQISPKSRCDWIVARDSAGVEMHRVEVWTSGPLALLYLTSRHGESHLQFRALTDLPAMRQHWREKADQLRLGAPSSVTFETDSQL